MKLFKRSNRETQKDEMVENNDKKSKAPVWIFSISILVNLWMVDWIPNCSTLLDVGLFLISIVLTYLMFKVIWKIVLHCI